LVVPKEKGEVGVRKPSREELEKELSELERRKSGTKWDSKVDSLREAELRRQLQPEGLTDEEKFDKELKERKKRW